MNDFLIVLLLAGLAVAEYFVFRKAKRWMHVGLWFVGGFLFVYFFPEINNAKLSIVEECR